MQKKSDMKSYMWLLLFVTIAVLCWLFPYTGDDWAWGSSIGIERLNNRFRNYSGRYFGNMFVLVLTRFRILRAVVTASFVMGISYLIVKISNCGRCMAFLALALLFSCPKEMYRETIAWTSGFSNYVTSITFFLVYIYSVRDLFSDKIVEPKKKYIAKIIFLFISGCASAMIVEHVTLMQIVLSAGIAIYGWIKKKKIDFRCISYFLGSVLGAIIMFSNDCYSAAMTGRDDYRRVARSIPGILECIWKNYFNNIGRRMILNSVVLELFAAVIITILFIDKYNEYKAKLNIAKICIILIDLSAFYGLIKYVNSVWSDNTDYVKYINGCINFLFWTALLLFTFITALEEGKKARMICIILAIACASGSLLVVTPIGPRCFFADYVLMVWYCAECMSEIVVKEEIKGLTFIGSVLITVFILCVNFAIYGSLYIQDKQWLEIIRQAEQAGESEVTLSPLKYEDYIQCPRLVRIWEDRYKMFYGISLDIKVNYSE